MGKQSIDTLVNGGKASAAPPLGPALGPLGVNIGQVVAEINKKTAAFAGMQVPVKVEVDDDTKEFTISVGTPPASGLIKKECNIEKASANAKTEFVADMKIEQVIKVAQMKEDDLLGKDAIARVKEIIGTCVGIGIMVEGKHGKEVLREIEAGKYVDKIKAGKTELTAEEQKEIEAEKKRLQSELKEKYDTWNAITEKILKEFEGKSRKDIAKRLNEQGVPESFYNDKLPADKKNK